MQPFQWSAIHCLEKYVKGILVLNRLDSKDFKHSVSTGINRINDSGKFEIELSPDTLEYIDTLERYGAEHRYYEVSYVIEAFALMNLDLAVWEIRRYCQVLDFDITLGSKDVNILQANLRRIRDAKNRQEKNTAIIGGFLEKVMKIKKHPAREPLIWKNFRFGESNRKRMKVRPMQEWGNAPLAMYPEIVEEVIKYARVPKGMISAAREANIKREAEIRREKRKASKAAKSGKIHN